MKDVLKCALIKYGVLSVVIVIDTGGVGGGTTIEPGR